MSGAWWLREMFAALLGVLASVCALVAVLFVASGDGSSAWPVAAVALVSGGAALWLRLGAALRPPSRGGAR